MMMMKREMLGNQLRRSREVFGYSQIQVANLLGVSRQTVSNWENDKTIPDGISLIQLADIYHISLDKLCGRTVLLKSTSHSVSKVEIGQMLGLVGVFLCCSLVSLTKNRSAQRISTPCCWARVSTSYPFHSFGNGSH